MSPIALCRQSDARSVPSHRPEKKKSQSLLYSRLYNMGGGHSTASSRILVLGIDGAGKTSFLNKYENPGGAEVDVQPTDGFIVKDVKVKGVKLNVWDVAGKEATRSLWKHYYEQGHTDAIIWVVDSADSDERLEESRNALQGALLDPHLQGTYYFNFALSPPYIAPQGRHSLSSRASSGLALYRPFFRYKHVFPSYLLLSTPFYPHFPRVGTSTSLITSNDQKCNFTIRISAFHILCLRRFLHPFVI